MYIELLARLLAVTTAWAQTQTVPPTAPTPNETPKGDYSGPLRPQVHFSPPVGFMNDPNGMFKDSNGTWHLYYQFSDNPTDVVAGNQHWGHATSQDLYKWTNQPIALYPPNNRSGIFSGSAVVDTNNTSGFFNNTRTGVVAIYTLNTPTEQTQEIAFSYDGGYTFEPYSGNPVISVNSTQFRDPKVFWHEPTRRWVMVVAFSVEFSIAIYTSPNLLQWTRVSEFAHAGLLGLQYECPGLERLPIEGKPGEYAWMLYISINPGAPYGGSIGEYFVGDFNGTHFTPYDRAARIADWGKDNYATQFFYAPGEEPTSIAWASNWQYTNRVPTAKEGWRSIMSLPRRNFLANATRIGYVLGSRPVDLGIITDSQLAYRSNLANDSLVVDYSGVPSGALRFQINITYPNSTAALPFGASLNFTLWSAASNENITGGYFLSGENAGAIWMDRGGIKGFDDAFFTDKFSLTQAGPPWASSIEGVVDRSVIELFLDGGHFSATNLFYPQQPLDRMRIGTQALPQGMVVSVGVWGLKAGW